MIVSPLMTIGAGDLVRGGRLKSEVVRILEPAALVVAKMMAGRMAGR